MVDLVIFLFWCILIGNASTRIYAGSTLFLYLILASISSHLNIDQYLLLLTLLSSLTTLISLKHLTTLDKWCTIPITILYPLFIIFIMNANWYTHVMLWKYYDIVNISYVVGICLALMIQDFNIDDIKSIIKMYITVLVMAIVFM